MSRKQLLLAAILILTSLALLMPSQGLTEEKFGKATYFFDQAIQHYLKGDSRQAIDLLNQSLGIDPDNQRAKVFLLKILVERGSRLFLAKKYKKAYDYLSQAYHMDSGNPDVKKMFELASKQIKPQTQASKITLVPKAMRETLLQEEAKSHVRSQGKTAVQLKAKKPEATAAGMQLADTAAPQTGIQASSLASAALAPADSALAASFIQDYAKSVSAMTELVSAFQAAQEKQIDQFIAPMERIQNLYYESEQDRKRFINQLDLRFKSVLGDISWQQRLIIYGFSFAFLLLGIIVWIFFMIVRRMRSRREESIMKYQQEMLKMIRDLSVANPYAGLPPGGANWQLPNQQPLAAALPQMPAMSNTAALPIPNTDPLSSLKHIIHTGNYKERSLAAAQMLTLDLDQALDIIREMITNQDPFLRENMLAALGENYHPLTLDLLSEGLKDNEKRVVSATLRALKRLLQTPGDVIPDDARNEIQLMISTAAKE